MSFRKRGGLRLRLTRPTLAVLVSFPADGSAADARIRKSTVAPSVKVQITCDHDREAEWRLKVLHRDGLVSGAGPIGFINGRLEAEGRGYDLAEIILAISERTQDRLQLKFAKCPDQKMWLLVHITDELLPPGRAP